jgi:hypothetical protein
MGAACDVASPRDEEEIKTELEDEGEIAAD